MSLDSSPQISILRTGGYISTLFVHGTVANQAAANSVYAYKSTVDGQNALSPQTANRVYTFKSDRERMQYLIGRIGTVPQCTGT